MRPALLVLLLTALSAVAQPVPEGDAVGDRTGGADSVDDVAERATQDAQRKIDDARYRDEQLAALNEPQEFAQWWAGGGGAMYLVALLLLAAFPAALLHLIFSKGWSLAVAGLLALAVLAAGALGTAMGRANVAEAVANVNPADREIILAYGNRESAAPLQLGGYGFLALGLLITVGEVRRKLAGREVIRPGAPQR